MALEDGLHEKRHDDMENMFIRLEGKIDLINLQLEQAAALTLERSGNISAAVRLNQDSIARHHRDEHENELDPKVRSLEDWRRDLKAYGKGALVGACLAGATGGTGITLLIEAIVKATSHH